jgi:hypothetical protein
MPLPLNAEMVERAYRYLCCTPPFHRWRMPSDVKFRVKKLQRDYASYQWDGARHVITISASAVGHSETLLQKLSHEMIHMRLEETGRESRRGGQDTHNAEFRRMAAIVCRHHGFDPKAFY